MKKHYTFDDIINDLKNENVPYQDQKSKILSKVSIRKRPSHLIKRVALVAAVSSTLLLASVAIATDFFGTIKAQL